MSVKILNYKKLPNPKGGVVPTFSTQFESGMVVHDMCLGQKSDSRWVGLPRQTFRKKDGSEGHTDIIQFSTPEIAKKFQAMILEALDLRAVLGEK